MINDAEADQRIYAELSRISKAIASPRRLELVHLLAQAERTVEELASLSSMSMANTSRHLQALLAARLVSVRRAGLHAHYRLADERVFRLWQAVRDLGEARLARMRELVRSRFPEPEASEPVDLAGLERRVHDGDVILLDVRPEHEFSSGHIPGAVSLPADEFEARLHVIAGDLEILVCGRGPYCGLAQDALVALLRAGYRARRLAAGYPDWRAAAPVDSPRGHS